MAAFDPIKTGGWAFGEILTSAQMNKLNTDFPFALNGRDGGAYSMSDSLVLVTASGKVISLNGSSFNDDGDLALAGFLLAPFGAQVTGTLNVTGYLQVSQDIGCGVVYPTGVNNRIAALSVTVDVTINTSNSDLLRVTGASAARNITLGAPAAGAGTRYEVRLSVLAFAQTIKATGGAALVTMQGTSGTAIYASFMHNGSDWELLATRVVP